MRRRFVGSGGHGSGGDSLGNRSPTSFEFEDGVSLTVVTSATDAPLSTSMGGQQQPMTFEPDTPMLGSTGRHVPYQPLTGATGGTTATSIMYTQPSSFSPLRRPRFVMTLALIGLTTFLLLPAPGSSNHQNLGSTALTKAGVKLPNQLVPDRLHDLFEYWNFGSMSDDGSNDLRYVPPPPPSSNIRDAVEIGRQQIDKLEKESIYNFDKQSGHLQIQDLSSYKLQPVKPHPILTLIERAELEWSNKLSRQSKTLKDAAREYRKRYKRNPPKGFDRWWAYAKQNKIVLTDEYDQIEKDLQPFWALDPSDLHHRVQVMQQREETFTIRMQDGQVWEEGEQAFLRRAKDLRNLINRFAAMVPDLDLNMTFTRHDQPAVRLGWHHRERLKELAELGEYFGPSDYLHEPDTSLSNWAQGCSPDSPLRQIEQQVASSNPSSSQTELAQRLKAAYTTTSAVGLATKRSFIYDYQPSLDICQHPEIMPMHGFTSVLGTNEGPLVPLFTFAKTNIHSDVLVTPLEQYSPTYIGYDPPWEKKEFNKLMWRGSTTGIDFLTTTDWKNSQRARLHFLTHDLKGSKQVLISNGGKDAVVKEEIIKMHNLNKAYMDVSFSGGPVQCDETTCQEMSKLIDFQPTMGLTDSYKYKYVIDVDGNGWSGRFHRLMSMKACVLKSTLFPEWYGDRIQPWVHYVPVKVDYSDLYDIMTFFRGSPDGKNDHDELGRKIGLQGKQWAQDHWREQDMASYMFRLVLEWNRLLHRGDEMELDYDG
ncbi:hypothetical protein OIO90_002193 [Microbotryomycetes sp. JL221]|nr:hypothetical protein OIO90_002193 [Microbotryomycetes sp. JL221]